MSSYVIGIDIGGTMIKGALLNKEGELIEKYETESHAEVDADAFIANIITFVNHIRKGHENVISLGIGIAGLLNNTREILIESPNLPTLKNVLLKSEFESSLKLPVFIENDANIAALGELYVGEGKNLDSFLLMTLGTGLGSGLILNGELCIGETGKGGELGHTIVQPDGKPCSCGKKGCLEAYCSGSAMVNMAKEALEANKPSSLLKIYNNDPSSLTPKAIYTEAENNDELCHDIFKKTAKYLAIGISNVNNLIDIHNFIIGGGVSKASHIFKEGLIEEVKQNVFNISKNKIRIMISTLGNDAGILGAGWLAIKGVS
jgi:glucokinase